MGHTGSTGYPFPHSLPSSPAHPLSILHSAQWPTASAVSPRHVSCPSVLCSARRGSCMASLAESLTGVRQLSLLHCLPDLVLLNISGSFATYDAMALLLLAFATWLGVRAAQCGFRAQLILMVVAGSMLALADATKYAATLFDPVVIAAVGLAVLALPVGLETSCCRLHNLIIHTIHASLLRDPPRRLRLLARHNHHDPDDVSQAPTQYPFCCLSAESGSGSLLS